MPNPMWQRAPDGRITRRPPETPPGEPEAAGDPIALRALRARPLRALGRAARDTYEHLWTAVGASIASVGLLMLLALGAGSAARRLPSGDLGSLLLSLACF